MGGLDKGIFIDAVRSWKGRKVVVFGDMILDEFIYGRTDRVSREAPVVIVRYDGSDHCPGGAGNAAQNVAALGGRAVPIGIAANDESGTRLREYFREMNIPYRGVVSIGRRATTTKTRVMAGDYHAQKQQIVRIDREDRERLEKLEEDRILSILEKKTAGADAVILSDYGQGIFSDRVIRRSITICKKARIPVVADSRFGIERFNGVTTATPNEVEAARAAGVDISITGALEKTGRRLIDTLSASSLLVTRGRFGMSLFINGEKRIDIGVTGSPEATDVTGAGDTVVSAVALSLAAGYDMKTAMILANTAASVVVMKRGTAVASPEEIIKVLENAG
ncbi:MAG: bifunctional hydroxymethylpyrimidine kinase/phosphomethylpyrimidine kinase [Bacteroidales bacterium]|nr:bifunctional hydroxymethylpyrimidine kinase/phosphomethylpyrimidine kinase [Candidatus Latescibacterota bacterium]